MRRNPIAEYTAADGAVAKPAEAPVPITKTVKVNVTILRKEPQSQGGTAVITVAEAKQALHKANEPLAQAGVRVLASGFTIVDPPNGVNLNDGLDQRAGELKGGKFDMTAEEISLLSDTKTDAGQAVRTPATDDIELYFVNFLKSPIPGELGARGEAFNKSPVPDVKYLDSIIISKERYGIFTIAHEITHVLTDDGSHPNPLESLSWSKLMNYDASPTGGQVTDSELAAKRLSVEEELLMAGWPR